jgi:4'-phosphopantetheinyl transferase EntD
VTRAPPSLSPSSASCAAASSASSPPRAHRCSLGAVVVVAVDPDATALASLPPGEQALAAGFGVRRRATFVAGRVALRHALLAAGVVTDVGEVGVVGRDDRGAPLLPPSLAGRVRVSITHKDSHAAALVADVAVLAAADGIDAADVGHVGLDLELDEPRTRARTDGLARQVLTAAEHAALSDEDAERRRAVLLRFAAKEALYKAIDPFLRRYVGFLDVGVVVEDGGGLTFTPPADAALVAHGEVVDVGAPLILTTCHARARRDVPSWPAAGGARQPRRGG